jgi:NDP-mannose synthase
VERRAVILAGGKGTRLAPYTTVLPKPLMPIGDRAILDVVVRQLASHGYKRLTFAVGYLAHLVRAVFGDGEAWGVSIEYHEEEQPLGTAGPLALVGGLDGTFLAMNGDVLTTLDYAQLMRFHKGNEAQLTIATHAKKVNIDLGVVHSDDGYVTEYVEKPSMKYDVSMGVYVYDPEVLELIPERRFDFPDVVNALLEAGRKVAVYTGPGVWFDIGTVGEHERATAEIEAHPELFEDA